MSDDRNYGVDLRVLETMLASTCFGGEVCPHPPCKCARAVADAAETTKDQVIYDLTEGISATLLKGEIEHLRNALGKAHDALRYVSYHVVLPDEVQSLVDEALAYPIPQANQSPENK